MAPDLHPEAREEAGMAIDPREMMSPRERLVHNVNMRTHDADGAMAPPSADFVREDLG